MAVKSGFEEMLGSPPFDPLEGEGCLELQAALLSCQRSHVAAADMHACSVRVDAFVRPRLHAIQIETREALEGVRKMAEEWSLIALQEREVLQSSIQAKGVLLDSNEINDSIAFALERMLEPTCGREEDTQYDVYACVESESVDQKIQGLMLVEKGVPYVSIKYLVANPYSLCFNSAGIARVKGAGRCLVEHAKELARAKEERYRFISLEFAKFAEGFYLRCGFTLQGSVAKLAV